MLLPIEEQASPRRIICRLSDRQRDEPQFLTTDVLAVIVVYGPVTGFRTRGYGRPVWRKFPQRVRS
jgi:hypothetical protein